jgi:PII-like signaling protein
VTGEALKLTTYFGERDRAGGAFLADALVALYARHGLRASVVLRGVGGFGVKHHLHTDRLLTLSEDLPMVSVAVDSRERIEGLLGEVVALSGDGLITLERTSELRAHGEDATKLTVYVGRGERVDGRPAHVAAVETLRRCGVAGATVLLGVDGTVEGVRRRARFLAGNAQVPLMIIAIGDGEPIARGLAELQSLLGEPLLHTLERVRVCKRDGFRLAQPHDVAATDPSGLAVWQKLMVYCGEQSRHGDEPLYEALIRALRAEGAAGATALRGIWGYHGDHEPHGDRLWQLRRRVPIVLVIVDTPERISRWFAVVDALTDETGLVTSEQVPAMRAVGPGVARGGLRLADPGVR